MESRGHASSIDVEHIDDGKKESPEDEQRTFQENRCRERFVKEHIMKADLNILQKFSALDFIANQPGPWRENNGADITVAKSSIEREKWRVSFNVILDGHEAQRIDVVVPLSS